MSGISNPSGPGAPSSPGGALVDLASETTGTLQGSKMAAATPSVPGSISAADKTKLNAIEATATVDQTDVEIKTAYENNANTNEFSDSEQTKLGGIEALADVTDSANVAAAKAPVWQKFTISEAAFTAAVTSEDIELFQLLAGHVIHAVKIKHSAAFTGGGLTAYTLSVGIVGTLAKYASAFDVFQAPGPEQISSVVDSEGPSIRLAAVSTNGNVADATAGSVDVWVLVSDAS